MVSVQTMLKRCDGWKKKELKYKSQCQNSSKFLSVSYLKKTADVLLIFFSSHNTTDHT